MLIRKRLLRILKLYGFNYRQHPHAKLAVQVFAVDSQNRDRLVRFASHVERTKALRPLKRVARMIQRQYGLPDRTRYKQV